MKMCLPACAQPSSDPILQTGERRRRVGLRRGVGKYCILPIAPACRKSKRAGSRTDPARGRDVSARCRVGTIVCQPARRPAVSTAPSPNTTGGIGSGTRRARRDKGRGTRAVVGRDAKKMKPSRGRRRSWRRHSRSCSGAGKGLAETYVDTLEPGDKLLVAAATLGADVHPAARVRLPH